MKFKDLTIGMSASCQKLITEKDILDFANISGDHNPIHMNEHFAQNSMFGQRIAHGMISSSLFSGIFGTELPGEGALYISQNVKFKAPVYINDLVKAEVTITHLCTRTRKVTFNTKCTVGGKTVIVGKSEILTTS